MIEKERLKVVVNTIPNGYALSVEDNNYMYFTLDKLLGGFMYHVGLEELGAIDNETMQEFIAAAIVWKENGEAIKEVVKLQKDNEALRSALENTKRQLASARKMVRELKDGKGVRRGFDDDDDE